MSRIESNLQEVHQSQKSHKQIDEASGESGEDKFDRNDDIEDSFYDQTSSMQKSGVSSISLVILRFYLKNLIQPQLIQTETSSPNAIFALIQVVILASHSPQPIVYMIH